MLKEEKLNFLRNKYPVGTRIRLIFMDDNYPVPPNTKGTVDYIDDEGQIQMKWDNGSHLALVYGTDKFEKIIEKNKDKER